MFNKICIIGMGLMGGSIAKAARKYNLAHNIVAFGRKKSLKNLQLAKKSGIVDEFYIDLESAIKDANCIIICTPVGATEDIFRQLLPFWNAQTIVSDVGSTKGSVIAAAQTIFGQVPANFVPAHPIAGSENSGIEAAQVELYQNKRLIITPLDSTCPKAVNQISQFWQKMGAIVSVMEVAQHDAVLAATSHLPHILAFSLVYLLGQKDEQEELFKYAAGGLKDFTRIASSDPTMWLDICVGNKNEIVPLIQQLKTELDKIEHRLVNNQSQQLFEIFSYANQARQRFLNQFKNAMSQSITFNVQPGGSLCGEIRVPGDKSISHRSIMLGSLAEGITRVTGFLNAEDALATVAAFKAMGVKIEGPINGEVTIHGVGKQGLKEPKEPLYLGNSGTSIRLLSGLLAGQKFNTVLTGDSSLSSRPMKRVTEPLAKMGANIKATKNGTAPLHIIGTGQLKSINYNMPIASAQVKSCLLFAGMYASGETTVVAPAPTRDHTERMLSGFSYPVQQKNNTTTINSAAKLIATNIDIPADISSAAFFLVGASIAENSDVTLKHVGINPTRIGIISILRLMGANISVLNERLIGGEPVADLSVISSPLQGIDIPEQLVPLAIDEFPVLFVAAACAKGQTRLAGARELRVKESDRIQVMADGLQILGVDLQTTEDGVLIQGKTINSMTGGEVESHGDHRIAMSFAIAGLRASAPIIIRDCENVNTSFPEFYDLATQLGLNLK